LPQHFRAPRFFARAARDGRTAFSQSATPVCHRIPFEIASPCFIPPESVDEYLRSFSGFEGVLVATGVYRAAFKTIEQTEPLRKNKVTVPVIALGGANAQGNKVREMVSMVAVNVTGHVVSDCGHFLPEECPEEIARQIQAFTE
jgi:pimeloyl-ACP methyl ester carboxylesterase